MDTYRGIHTIIENYAELDQHGYWGVTYTLTQKRSVDLQDWESKSVKMTSYGRDLNKTIASAVLSINIFLEKYNYDLFSIDQLPEGTDTGRNIL